MPDERNRRGRSASIALGLFVFLGACKRAPPPPPPPAPAAAQVNGAPILVSRLQLELDRVRRGENGGPGIPVEPADIPRVARSLLDALVNRAIVLQRAKLSGMQVSEAEVQRATDALAESSRKGGETFAARLAKDGLTPEQLADEMRERLLAGKYVAEQTGKERASSAEARSFFDTHRAEFDEPEMVHCLQIVVRTPEEAKSVLDQLRRGASFAELAQKISTSPDARNGGDLGFFPRGTMPKVFDDSCFTLGNGKISGVVASPYGFHVFKVLGRRARRTRKFEDVRGEAERRSTAEKQGQAERELLKQLRAAADVKVDEASFALLH